MGNKEVKIILSLNAVDASLVLASLQTTKEMLNVSMDMAISDGLLPIVKLAKGEIARIDNIIHKATTTNAYSSDSFVTNQEEVRKQERESIAAISMLKNVMNKKEPPKEEGKNWDKAGDNVVSILDKFKKDKPDDTK